MIKINKSFGAFLIVLGLLLILPSQAHAQYSLILPASQQLEGLTLLTSWNNQSISQTSQTSAFDITQNWEIPVSTPSATFDAVLTPPLTLASSPDTLPTQIPVIQPQMAPKYTITTDLSKPTETPSPTPIPTSIPTPQSTIKPSTDPSPIAITRGLSADKLFEMANIYRASLNLSAFQKDDRSCTLAVSRAPEINYEIASGIMHQGLRARNLDYWNTENIISMNSEQAAFNWWIHDKIHKDALEGDYKYSCVACSGNACAQEFTNFSPK